MPRGRQPYFTDEQQEEMVRRYLAGESMPAIGKSYGVSTRPVEFALKRRGIQRRTVSDYAWKPTPENRAELVRLWNEGGSIPKIARQAGTGNDTVSRILREEGIQPRYGGQNHRFKEDEIPALVKEYAATHSLARMAKRYECSTAVIRKTLQRAGVEIRPYDHPPKFWTEERVQWLREQHEAGRSQEDIGREIGYTQGHIGRVLRDKGILSPQKQAKGPASRSWQGGKIIDGGGYVRVRVLDEDRHLVDQTISGGYVLEHRLVMARSLGRALLATETVHHIDGDKLHNDPENLQLRQGNHGRGVMLRCADCGSHNVEAVPLT